MNEAIRSLEAISISLSLSEYLSDETSVKDEHINKFNEIIKSEKGLQEQLEKKEHDITFPIPKDVSVKDFRNAIKVATKPSELN